MRISVVIPVYNAASSIKRLVEEIEKELSALSYEIILVNDCSADNTDAICTEIARENKHVKFISLRKNFGEHNAVLCGLNYTTGDYIAIMDDDFQNPPSELHKLIKKISEGNYDVVYSSYSKKEHAYYRNLGSWFTNRMATYLLNKPKDLYLSSFKIMTKGLVKEIIKYQGPFPYIDGLIFRVTNSFGVQEVNHAKRADGKSNYNIKRLISLYMKMFLNFSVKPLRFFTITGFFIFIFGILLSIAVIIEKFYYRTNPPGWTFNAVAILTLSGFQIMFLGMISEYLGKMFLSTNQTPSFSIRKEIIEGEETRK